MISAQPALNAKDQPAPKRSPFAVVAAMKMEVARLQRRAGDRLHLITTGIGVENVERSLHAHLQAKRAEAVLGIGLAGALSPVLRVGDLVIGQEVWGPSRLTSSPELLSLAREARLEGNAIYPGTVITVNEPVRWAGAKQRLASTMVERPVACVDMESWAIARFCAGLQIPFLIVRAISDAFDEELPLDFNRYRRSDGRLDLPGIVGAALIHPWLIGGLWNLGCHARLCTRRLVQFVEQMLLATAVRG